MLILARFLMKIVEEAMWTEYFEKLPPSNSLVIPYKFKAPNLNLKPLPKELKYAILGKK